MRTKLRQEIMVFLAQACIEELDSMVKADKEDVCVASREFHRAQEQVWMHVRMTLTHVLRGCPDLIESGEHDRDAAVALSAENRQAMVEAKRQFAAHAAHEHDAARERAEYQNKIDRIMRVFAELVDTANDHGVYADLATIRASFNAARDIARGES